MKKLNKLIERYHEQVEQVRRRTFGLTEDQLNTPEWRFRRLIANVIVGGGHEVSALNAVSKVFSVWHDMAKLAQADENSLSKLLEHCEIKWSKKRAQDVISVTIEVLKHGDIPTTREELEKLPGVGRHTASVVLALALDQNEFGVDLHVSRIAKRFCLVPMKATNKKVEEYFVNTVRENLGTLSRAFVEHGHAVCGYDPNCAACFLSTECPSAKVNINHNQVPDGQYKVPSKTKPDQDHLVIVSNGVASCDCKGYKYRRTCSHIKEDLPLVAKAW